MIPKWWSPSWHYSRNFHIIICHMILPKAVKHLSRKEIANIQLQSCPSVFENRRCLVCFGLYVLQRVSDAYAMRPSKKSSDILRCADARCTKCVCNLFVPRRTCIKKQCSSVWQCDKTGGIDDDILWIEKYGSYTNIYLYNYIYMLKYK